MAEGDTRLVQARTVSGDVDLDLRLRASGHYDVATVSGDIGLRTPEEPSMVVEATSVSGDLITDLGLDWEDPRPARRRVRRTFGGGDSRLVLKTVSGDLRLLQRSVA